MESPGNCPKKSHKKTTIINSNNSGEKNKVTPGNRQHLTFNDLTKTEVGLTQHQQQLCIDVSGMSDVCAWVWVCVFDPQVRHNMWSNHQRMGVGVGYSDYCYRWHNLKPPSYFYHQSSARPPRLVSHMWRRPSLLAKYKATHFLIYKWTVCYSCPVPHF